MEQKEADLDVEESKQDILGKGRIARLFGRKDLLSGFYPFFQARVVTGLEEFYDRSVCAFDPEEEENKLEYTALFEEYTQLLESFVQEFLDCKGVTSVEFFEELRQSMEGSRSGKVDNMLTIINAWSDFVFFVDMMKDKARNEQTARLQAREHK